ncbi:MAG TPA: hypothetical protein VHC42_03670 [Rhizomicrobium sp.]|nr:hypothetical protein [Rhizomicrobium sp.]
MNNAGDVVGASYADPGCGPFCLPQLDTVVWKAGQRVVLPALAGFDGASVSGINNRGWISGGVGPYGFGHAVVWKPKKGARFSIIDLGTLPGGSSSSTTGIDDAGRAVGTSTDPSGFNKPFVWTALDGMVDLTSLGYPGEPPLGISAGGTVATFAHWYRLDDPKSVTDMAAVPPGGWFLVNSYVAINDSGDQARGLAIRTEHPITFNYRYTHEGTWQQIDFIGTGVHARGGLGSIDDGLTVTNTASSSGQIALGPDGVNQPLSGFLSPAYGGSVTVAGQMNSAGDILAQVMIGNAARMMRLVAATPCQSACIRIPSLSINAKFHQDPKDPGHCVAGNPKEFNTVTIRARVTDENGAPLAGVQVRGRFMDEYWKNTPASGVTDANGLVKFKNKGPCGVGAESFVVEDASLSARTFDKTLGRLAVAAIPKS